MLIFTSRSQDEACIRQKPTFARLNPPGRVKTTLGRRKQGVAEKGPMYDFPLAACVLYRHPPVPNRCRLQNGTGADLGQLTYGRFWR
jgi:hypothetical protein